MLSVGWFSTGRGEGSLGLLRFVQERILKGEIDARIQFVFSNRGPAEAEGSDRFFQQVQGYGLPLRNLSSRRFRDRVGGNFAEHRLQYDREVMDLLKEFQPDVVVLAGYMLIVGAEMCGTFTMLNLHPSLPTGPVGTWQEVIWDLIASRAQSTGAMVHLVTEDLDRGPVVGYFTLPLVGGDFEDGWKETEGRSITELKSAYGEELPLFRLIRREGYSREPYLIAATLNALSTGKIQLQNGQVIDSNGGPVAGYCLDHQIEEAMVPD